jgi:hypothetical protein
MIDVNTGALFLKLLKKGKPNLINKISSLLGRH